MALFEDIKAKLQDPSLSFQDLVELRAQIGQELYNLIGIAREDAERLIKTYSYEELHEFCKENAQELWDLQEYMKVLDFLHSRNPKNWNVISNIEELKNDLERKLDAQAEERFGFGATAILIYNIARTPIRFRVVKELLELYSLIDREIASYRPASQEETEECPF